MNHTAASAPLAETFEPRSETDTRLHGSWLILVRVGWLVVAVFTLIIVVASLPVYVARLQTLCPGTACSFPQQLSPEQASLLKGIGLSPGDYAAYTVALTLATMVMCLVVSTVIVWRRSDDRMAFLVALMLVTIGPISETSALKLIPSPWQVPTACLYFLALALLILVFLLFPSGQFVPRWTRWTIVVFLVGLVPTTFFPDAPFTLNTHAAQVGNLLLIGEVALLAVVQLYRYRRVSSPLERQQTKWVVFGIALPISVFVGGPVLSLIFPALADPNSPYGTSYQLAYAAVNTCTPLLFPISLGMAILRSRLWDIDVLINRTLVYGILTICVVGVYVLVVGALGALIGASGNLLISLVATGLVAVLFQPLRAWVQRGVNRLLYGQRDEPYTVITHLSQRLEATLAPDAVLSTVVETVAQALKLPYVAILLKQEDTFRLAASAGELVAEPLILPLVYQQDAIGQIRLAPRTPGQPFTPADRRLLDELVRQAGFAAHAVQLTADLQRSYEQLEQRVAERTRELSSLLEISHTVASTLQLKPLLGLILEQLKLVIEYTGSSILTVEGEDLVFLDHRNPVSQEPLTPLRFPVKNLGLMWETLRSRESIIVPDLREETPLAQAVRVAMGELRETTLQDVHAWMAVPLILRDQVIGMLVLTSSQAQAFTERQATLALAIANQAAIAIENARLYEQAQALAALEERQKLARELHDSVSQALYGISLGAHAARAALSRDPDHVAEPIDYVLSLAEAGLAEMRALIFELRPESLETEGLVSALTKQAAALQARHEIAVSTELCDEPNLPLRAKQELYRIAQEAMHNIVKHARASKVVLRLEQAADGIMMEMRDDGVGFDTTASFPGHLGLHSMRERVANLGGTFQVASTPGAGTCICVHIPGRV
jgi:signal transduction histidine kinase